MYFDRILSANFETPLITRDALATQQWEAVLADDETGTERRAWPSRPFRSWPGWLSLCFATLEAERGDGPSALLLSPGQTDRLWRHVIEASKRGADLIGSAGVARWARSARRGLFEHGLAPAEQAGALWRDDAAVFLDWNRHFEAELARNRWVDPDSLLYRLNRSGLERVAADLILLDPPRATPEVERLIERLNAAGRRIERVAPDAHEANVRAVIAADPADEIRLAARWAGQRLRERPGSRLAVVVPGLEARRDEVEAVFADRLGAARVTGTGGRRVVDIAILGAAVTALRLLGGGGFETMSRWLRSPFFSSRDEARVRQAARLELVLRGDPRAQGEFTDAWRRHGLDGLFERYLPDASQQLDQALDRLPERATPTGWTAAWQSCLRTLGWHGVEGGLPARLQSAWDNAWARFTELTAIVGPIDRGTALEALSEIVATESIYDPIALEGVTILSRPDQVGPGFGGVWMTGFTDQALAPAEGPNPLLPWAVQARLDMPGARPETALAAATEDLERLRRRVPEARFSSPARIGDEPRIPSPLIAEWEHATEAARQVAAEGYAAARIGARRRQSQADPAPAFTGETIPGGTRTLDLQSDCPVKAFCIARLRAEPVEPPARGIGPKLRGLLLHRALELALDPAGSGGSGAPVARVGDAVERAIARASRRGDAGWQAQLRAERDRLERIVGLLLEIDAARAPFATIAVEHRTRIPVRGRVVNCRIDRIDRLASGETLLIDYKTGQAPLTRWFEDRLGDCQLPLYAQGTEPGAIAAVRLDDDRIDYRWAGRETLSVPGRGQGFDAAAWRTQIARWREQIGELLDEFAAGDARVPLGAAVHVADDDREWAGGAFAPLTRVGDPP